MSSTTSAPDEDPRPDAQAAPARAHGPDRPVPPAVHEDGRMLAELGDVVVELSRHLQLEAHSRHSVVPLTGTEAMVLRWVDRHPGTTPSVAAEAMGLRRSNLSAALRSLDSKGMILRQSDPADSRIVHLRPTPRAAVSRARIRAHWAEVLAERLPDLDDEQRDILGRAIEILQGVVR